MVFGASRCAFSGSQALVVPRTRFAPVKTVNDLFVLRSDAYKISEDFRLVWTPISRLLVFWILDLGSHEASAPN